MDFHETVIHEICPIDGSPLMTCGHQTITKPIIDFAHDRVVSAEMQAEQDAIVEARRDARIARAADIAENGYRTA